MWSPPSSTASPARRSSCSSTPNGSSRSVSSPLARSTVTSSIAARKRSISAVLPMPAAPSTTRREAAPRGRAQVPPTRSAPGGGRRRPPAERRPAAAASPWLSAGLYPHTLVHEPGQGWGFPCREASRAGLGSGRDRPDEGFPRAGDRDAVAGDDERVEDAAEVTGYRDRGRGDAGAAGRGPRYLREHVERHGLRVGTVRFGLGAPAAPRRVRGRVRPLEGPRIAGRTTCASATAGSWTRAARVARPRPATSCWSTSPIRAVRVRSARWGGALLVGLELGERARVCRGRPHAVLLAEEDRLAGSLRGSLHPFALFLSVRRARGSPPRLILGGRSTSRR